MKERKDYLYHLNLKEILSKNKIIYCVVTHLDKGTIYTFGNKSDLAYQGIIKALFYDMDTIYSLEKSLDGQMLPQLYGQGEVSCIICKPTKNVIVGIFTHKQGDFIEHINWSKEINKQVELLWKDNNLG